MSDNANRALRQNLSAASFAAPSIALVRVGGVSSSVAPAHPRRGSTRRFVP
jgi:hypothetical protein